MTAKELYEKVRSGKLNMGDNPRLIVQMLARRVMELEEREEQQDEWLRKQLVQYGLIAPAAEDE